MNRPSPISYRHSSIWSEYPSRSEASYSYDSHYHPHPNPFVSAPPHHAYAPPPPARDPTPPPPHVIYVHPSSPHSSSRAFQTPPEELICELRDTDVLCGRGAPSQFHAGNAHFRDLVERFQSSYVAARRSDKPEIAVRLVDSVRERGGRFLKRTKVMQGVGLSGRFAWYVFVAACASVPSVVCPLRFSHPCCQIFIHLLGKTSGSNAPTRKPARRYAKAHPMCVASSPLKKSPRRRSAASAVAAVTDLSRAVTIRKIAMQQTVCKQL